MDASAIIVAVAAAAAIAGLGWYFFGPRKARAAQLAGGVQRLEVTVRGGYSPEVIRLRQGVPAELIFDRQESGDCTSRVVFPDLRVSAALPAYQRTMVRLDPAKAGTFGFACRGSCSSRMRTRTLRPRRDQAAPWSADKPAARR